MERRERGGWKGRRPRMQTRNKGRKEDESALKGGKEEGRKEEERRWRRVLRETKG